LHRASILNEHIPDLCHTYADIILSEPEGPITDLIGGTLLCAYHRTLRHHGSGLQADSDSNQAVMSHPPLSVVRHV